jgi:hypothetical protein
MPVNRSPVAPVSDLSKTVSNQIKVDFTSPSFKLCEEKYFSDADYNHAQAADRCMEPEVARVDFTNPSLKACIAMYGTGLRDGRGIADTIDFCIKPVQLAFDFRDSRFRACVDVYYFDSRIGAAEAINLCRVGKRIEFDFLGANFKECLKVYSHSADGHANAADKCMALSK